MVVSSLEKKRTADVVRWGDEETETDRGRERERGREGERERGREGERER